MWLRTPVELKRSPVLQPIWSVLVPLLQLNPAAFFTQCSALSSSTPLPPLLLPLLTALHSHTRRQSLRSVEQTYERVAEAEARRLLGLSGEEGKREWEELVRTRGWEVEEGGWVKPKKGEDEDGEEESVGLTELNALTKYIVQLEQ